MTARHLIETEDLDGVFVLSVDKGVTSINEDMLTDISNEFMAATYKNPERIIVDLSGVEFFGSSFVEVLFRVWNKMKGKKDGFALCGLSPYCREIFTVTNLEKLWKIYPTRGEALNPAHTS